MLGGVALRWNALDGVLLADDWDHYAMQQGIYPVKLHAFDKFNFVGRDAAARRALRQSGRLPWWAAPDLRLAVFRPLPSILVHFDFAVLRGHEHPRLIHLHSMLWWLSLVGAVAALLGSLLPRPAAALALLLYVVDDAHVLPVTWIANRSEIIAIGFVTWGLWLHLAAQRYDRKAARWLSLLLVGVGLLAGEHAIPPLAYFVAFELCSRGQPMQRRFAAIMPLILLVAGYLTLRRVLGYGVAASFYIEPTAEPLRYLAVSATRLPLLVGELMFGYAADWWHWSPPWSVFWRESQLLPPRWLTVEALRRTQSALGIFAVALALAWAVWLGRAVRSTETRRTIHWLLVGALLSLIPLCGTTPMSRLTVAPALGFGAAFGWLLGGAWTRVCSRTTLGVRAAAALLAASIVLIHGVHAARRSYQETTYYASLSRAEWDWVRNAELAPHGVAGMNIFVISAADFASQFYLPFVLHLDGRARPASSELLTPAIANRHELTRVATQVLDIRFPDRLLGEPYKSSVYLTERSNFQVGQSIASAHFHIHVLATQDGEPTHLRLVFPKALDDPSYLFVYPMPDGLKPVTLPPIGERLLLESPSSPKH